MTRTKFYEPIREDLYKGNYDAAVAAIEKARAEDQYAKKDRFLYYLDAGLAYHYAREYDSSNVRLDAAEQTNDDLYAKSISKGVLSFLVNDNVIDYRGEDYEVLYANLIKSLNYLELGNFEDAFVEVRRANLKLQQLEQKNFEEARFWRNEVNSDSTGVQVPLEAKKIRFANSAFARYLSMHMYAADGADDDAAIDLKLLKEAFATEPQIYDFSEPPVSYESKDAVISVVAFAGTAPVKRDFKLRLRTDKQLDLVQVLVDGGENKDQVYWQFPADVSEDYYFKFAIPVLTDIPSEVTSVSVWSEGRKLGELHLLEDIGAVAHDVFEAHRTIILAKTLGRALFKGLVNHKLKKKVKNDDVGGWLLKAAMDVTFDVTENADLRCSHLLPRRVYVGDFEADPGSYDLQIMFYDANDRLVSSTEVSNFEVRKGDFNLAEAFTLQ